MHRAIAVLLIGWLAAPGAQSVGRDAQAVPTLLVPAVELVDLAPPEQRYDQAQDAARAAMLGRRICATLARAKGYRLLEATTAPYRYTDCKACMARWARSQGADYVLVTWVQKESRLIVMENMALIDVAHPDRPAAGGSIDLRGDTDQTWLAGASQLLQRTVGVALGDE
jgi:hypothetical protein